jgi:hypothetical protein
MRISVGIPIPSPIPIATRSLRDNPVSAADGSSDTGGEVDWVIVSVRIFPFESVVTVVIVLATFVTIPKSNLANN